MRAAAQGRRRPAVARACAWVALAALALVATSAPARARDCRLPEQRAARLAALAPMAGFAQASGTTGGLDHPLFTFDSLEDQAPRTPPRRGTLRAAVAAAQAAGGGWIMPAATVPNGAEIVLRAPLRLPPNVTLDGGCQAPVLVSPPSDAVLQISAVSNVVVTRWILRVTPKNQTSARPGDCISVGRGSDRIWIAFNAIGPCGDGALDITQPVALPTPTRATVAFNLFAPHDKVMLLATLECGQKIRPEGAICPAPLTPDWSWSSGIQVTLQGNLFDGTGQRHPRVSGRVYVHMLDNVVAYRPYPRAGGQFGATYGTLVGGGARMFLDHGAFLPLSSHVTYAARAKTPTERSPEQPGAVRIVAAYAGSGATLEQYEPGLVPDPPYRLSGRLPPEPPADPVAAIRNCVGPRAEPAGCAP